MRYFILLYISILNALCTNALFPFKDNQPNILLVVTDDQDVQLDGMFPMRFVQKYIGEAGATFTNAFTSSPLCCPSRASIFSGMYAHNHRTKNNSRSGGCNSDFWRHKIEPIALPVQLQNAGYQTFFAGKYLNTYYGDKIPPGWFDFHGLHGNSRYFNFTLRENANNVSYTDEYLTDLLRDKALNFLHSQANSSKPFFAMITPPAPHAPYTPAERHRNIYAGVKAVRTPNFNKESGVLDKHWLVSAFKQITDDTLKRMDGYFQQRWETLLAVDELVADLIETLQQQQKLENTYIIYTSDNGYHMGQFAQPFDKRQPYETDIRIPLVIRGPNIAHGVKVTAPVTLVDLLPTILEWIKLPISEHSDGLSFNVFLMNAMEYDALLDKQYKRGILVEHWGEGNDETYNAECANTKKSDHLAQCTLDAECHCQDSWNNTYACIRHFRYNNNRLYCEFHDQENFVEAYDLNEDPYQMTNLGYDLLPIELALYSLALANLTHCSGSSCNEIYI